MPSAKKFINDLKLPARASLFYIGTSVLTKGLGFLITPLFTRALTEEEYGTFTLYISVLGVMSILASAFTSGSTVYVGLNKNKNAPQDYYRSLICSVLLFWGIICTLLFTFSPVFRLDYVFCLLVSLQVLFDALVGIYLSVLRFSYLYRGIVGISIFEAAVSPALSVLLIFLGVNGAFARIIALLAVSFITAVYSLSRLLRQEGRARWDLVKNAFQTSIPLLPHSASSAVTSGADKFIITAFLGNVMLARYSVVHSVSGGLSFLVSSLIGALTPWLSRHSGKGDEHRVREVLSLILRILSMLTLFLLAVIPEALRFLAPPEYSDALIAALPIALSTLPAFLIAISTIGLSLAEMSRYSVNIATSSAVLNIILNYMLIPIFGYLGAGLALLVSQASGAALALYYLKKCEKDYLIDTRELTFTFGLTVFFGILISLCKNLPALRPLLLIIPAVIMLNSLFSAKRYVTES